MELRDFAERVLFGTTLKEKLASPGDITDERPGPALQMAAEPGRPQNLRFKKPGGRTVDFPGIHRLECDEQRGLLLHFFANHELLATELMALTLLRFPEAPRAFREGMLKTLKEEQMHTRLYMRRMESCGMRFGDAPVSGFFWRAVSTLEHPADFVARFSLTFEQANLDYCRFFGDRFARVGDAATARLLRRIYRDEIGHVAHGLKWLRLWKSPWESDWEAFCGRLRFPLSPSRAKGIHFNAEARLEAGLDPAFIDELNVYSQSRGRTPGVFYFNPFAESFIAQGRRFQPDKSQVQLQKDLGNLPQYLCRQDDVVLVERRPSVRFLSTLKRAGFPLPEFVVLREGRIDPVCGLGVRKLARLRPWAWSPDSIELLRPLAGQAALETCSFERRSDEAIRELYSKSWSARFLKRFLTGSSVPDWVGPASIVGEPVGTVDRALEAIRRIREGGQHRIVVKECYGAAGHNMIRIWEPRVMEKQERWMGRAIERCGEVVVEPWLERLIDFSVQFEMEETGLRRVGYTGLMNEPGGQFQGCRAGPNHGRRLPVEPTMLFGGGTRRLGEFYDFYDELGRRLEVELSAAGYLGPLGIDALVYASAGGPILLKPIVELNPRYTMGRLTLELMNRIRPGRSGLFRLVNTSQLRKAGLSGWEDYTRSLAETKPLRLEGSPEARIDSGAICLNDPLEAKAYLAVFEVESAGRG